MRVGIAIVLLAVALGGCEKREDIAEQDPAAPAAQAGYALELAVYTAQPKDMVEGITGELAARFERAGWKARVEVLDADEYLVAEDYVAHDIGEQGLAELKRKQTVLYIFLASASGNLEEKFRAAHDAVDDIAHSLNGYIWDQGSWIMYGADRWTHAHDGWDRGAPFMLEHISIQIDRGDEGERLVTVGLGKFGLPELVLERTSPGERGRIVTLINLIAQHMVEHPGDKRVVLTIDATSIRNSIARDYYEAHRGKGGSGKIALRLTETEPGPNDPAGKLVAIHLGGAGTTAGERQSFALDDFFGPSEDQVHHIDQPGDAWRAASARALAELAKLKPRLQAGFNPMETLYVKAAFEEAGRKEWMWVDVLSWEGTVIRGRLANVPQLVENVKLGQEVTLDESELVDYLLVAADGTERGNFTGRTQPPEPQPPQPR